MRQFNFSIHAVRPPQPFNVRAAMQLRVDPDKPERGDRLRFYWSGPTAKPLQLGIGTCKSVDEAVLYRSRTGEACMRVGDVALLKREMEELARDAGFLSVTSFFHYFEGKYGLPFNGRLLRW